MKKYLLYLFTPLLSLFFVTTAKALELGVPIPTSKEDDGKEATISSASEYIGAVYKYAVWVGGSITTLMLIYAGLRYITSKGDPSGIKEAKDIAITTLSGFLLLLLIGLVMTILNIDYKL